MISIIWNGCNAKGDKIVYSSLPENYYRATGQRLYDESKLFSLDYNPYVIRKTDEEITERWMLWGEGAPGKTLAETICNRFNLPCSLNHPRLYAFEDRPKIPRSIVIHSTGISCGSLTQPIINHIKEQYYTYNIFQVGALTDIDCGVFDYRGRPIWDQIKIIAECETFIGIDSVMYHISSAYNMRRKIVLVNKSEKECYDFLPIPYNNGQWSGWLGMNAEFYNPFDKSLGITYSYLDI